VEHIVNFARTNSLAQTIYIFEIFDESEKPGAESEKHFGVEYENRQVANIAHQIFKQSTYLPFFCQPKFDIDISSFRSCSKDGWKLFDHQEIVGADLGVQVPAGQSEDCKSVCRETSGRFSAF